MKRILLVIIAIIAIFSVKGQTFIVYDVVPYSQNKAVIERFKRNIGALITLKITDYDVSVTLQRKGEPIHSKIFEKKSNTIFRSCTDGGAWASYDELDIDTFLGYMTGFTLTHIHDKEFGGAIKAKRLHSLFDFRW
jgi:hypothetical protein